MPIPFCLPLFDSVPPDSLTPAPRGFISTEDFSRLVRPHLVYMHAAALAVLRSDDLAWDAVQETLLRVWTRGWLPVRPRGALLSLTRQSSLHLRRCGQRRRFHEATGARGREPCCEQDPLLLLEDSERDEALRKALAVVPEELRIVYIRYQWEGHSYASIAAELGIPVGTVRSRLSRARTRLLDSLRESGTHEVPSA